MSKAKSETLDSLKRLSNSVKTIHSETLDFICPILSGLSCSLSSLDRKNRDFFDTLGDLVSSFEDSEDPMGYNIDIFKDALFHDEEFEGDKLRLCKEKNTSFMNFYRKKKQSVAVNSHSGGDMEKENLQSNHIEEEKSESFYDSISSVCKVPEIPNFFSKNKKDISLDYESPSISRHYISKKSKILEEIHERNKALSPESSRLQEYESKSEADTEFREKRKISPIKKTSKKENLVLSSRDDFDDIFFVPNLKKENLKIKKPLKMNINWNSNLRKSDMIEDIESEEEKFQEETIRGLENEDTESLKFESEADLKIPVMPVGSAANHDSKNNTSRTATFRNRLGNDSSHSDSLDLGDCKLFLLTFSL